MRAAEPRKPKAEALRQAQLTLLRGNERRSGGGDKNGGIQSEVEKARRNAKYAHPYFWAPFILIGNWRCT